MPRTLSLLLGSALVALLPMSPARAAAPAAPSADGKQSPANSHGHHHTKLLFDVRSVRDGNWSDAKTWVPARVPKEGDRVLITRGTRVAYDSTSKSTIRLLQVVGTLAFARDRNTELNVALLKVQNSDECSETGFSCDMPATSAAAGEPQSPQQSPLANKLPTLEVGTLADPIPAQFTARIVLHHLEGLDKADTPAVVCCSGRMDFHGAPLSRTWVKLGANAAVDSKTVTLSEPVTGWRVGDEVIVTASKKVARRGSYRDDTSKMGTEERRITKIDGNTLTLDEPLRVLHYGEGEFRSEVANLSRNVIVESADPAGVRGHTMYHANSQGGISYARFAHLGKEGVLGRYAIHFHLVGDTMRGSQVLGAAIFDSANRWVTIHGTEYLVVRDCVGYRSLGHGFFMEDGTEVYNLLDRNLGVQAFQTKKLPKQVLPFDPNDGAAFWWANGRNTLTRNVTVENDEYGYRFDMKHSSSFSSTLPITMPDGSSKSVDVRTIPIWRFEENEAHSEGVYGLVVACNGDSQPDTGIRDQKMLDQINKVDWTGPDVKHPHMICNLKIWEAHYAFRPQSPSMLIEDVRIHRVAYGIYRPTLSDQEFRNLHLTNAGGEPFNRGMDDASAQYGRFSVDGLKIDDFDAGNQFHPVVQMSDNNLSGKAESYFRNVTWGKTNGKRPLFNRGGSTRVDPFLEAAVPYYIYDYYGPGRHAKILSTRAGDLLKDGNKYKSDPPLTGDESVVAEVKNVEWPKLLDPIDDLPPATIITSAVRMGDKLRVTGISHDNGDITSVTVNDTAAKLISNRIGVADWSVDVPMPADGKLTARASDNAGNREQTVHVRQADLP